MGKLTGGPFYDLIGRTGNNVGRRVKGKNVFSMRPAKSNKPPTLAQLKQRERFGLMTHWLSRVTPVLDLGFAAYEADQSAYNARVSYNILHAVTGVSPNYMVDYQKVLFSRGQRMVPIDPGASSVIGAKLEYTWQSEVYEGLSAADDQIAIVVYNVARDLFVAVMNAEVRSAESYELQLPLSWVDDTVQSWMFAASDKGIVSDTVYVGQNLLI